MKSVSLFVLLFVLIGIDAQRTRTSTENESTQPRRTRGRVRFSLPIDVDAELADIPSKSIRPDTQTKPFRPETKSTTVVRKIAKPSTNYEVEELLDDIPNKNVRNIHKPRIITESRFEAANAPKKPLYEPLPSPQDEILPEDLFATFNPQITKADRIKETKKERIEETLEKKEVKEVKNNLKEETVKEEKISLDEETLTLNTKDISDDAANISSSSQFPEVTTSAEQVSSTENEIKKHEIKSQEAEPSTKLPSPDVRKLRTSRNRPSSSPGETTTATARFRSRARRPTQPSASTETASVAQNQRFRSRSRADTSSETPTRATRVRPARRRNDNGEENIYRSKGPSVLNENGHEGPVRTRTERKVTYPPTDNEPIQSEDKIFTVRPRRGPNQKPTTQEETTPLTKDDDAQRNNRGRSNSSRSNSRNRSQNQKAEAADVPKANFRRNFSRGRKIEPELENSAIVEKSSLENLASSNERTVARNDPKRGRRVETRKPEEIKNRVNQEPSSTQSSITSTERNPRRSNQRRNFQSRSEATSSTVASTEAQKDFRRRNHKKIEELKENLESIEKKFESSTERKESFKPRQRSRFLPPVIDEQKLEVLPLFESEAKTVQPAVKRARRPSYSRETMTASGSNDHEVKSPSSNEIQPGFRPREQQVEVTTKPVVRESVEMKVSEVVSTRRVVRPIVRKIKNKGKTLAEKKENTTLEPKSAKILTASRGHKKADLTKPLPSSEDEVGDSDNYPEAFKALILAKDSKKGSRPQTSEDTITKSAEKVVTAPRFPTTSSTTSTTSTIAPITSKFPQSVGKVNEEDNDVIPSSTTQPSRGTRRRFSLTTKYPESDDTPPALRNSKRPAFVSRKTKPIRSTVAPAHVSIVTEVSQTIRKQPRYHARFTAPSSSTEQSEEKEIAITTPKSKQSSSKTPRGLYSSRKGTSKKRIGKIDSNNQQQQLPSNSKKQNRYSSRYRSDLLGRSSATRPTSTPTYIPTVPTVTPRYVKQGIEDGKEIISIDEPVNSIPSDSLINGELLTPSNKPAKLVPASLVTTGTSASSPAAAKPPISIIERIIYSITAISSTIAPDKNVDETYDGPTKATAILKIPNRKDETDATNEIQTITTEKPTTVIERILSSISAIQASSTQSPKVGISTVSSTVSIPSSTTINTLEVIEDLSDEQLEQQRTISKLLALLKSISPTPRNDLVVVTPKTAFASSTVSSALNSDVEVFNVTGNSLENEPRILATTQSLENRFGESESTENSLGDVIQTTTSANIETPQSTPDKTQSTIEDVQNSVELPQSTLGMVATTTEASQTIQTTSGASEANTIIEKQTESSQSTTPLSIESSTVSVLSNTIDSSNPAFENILDSTIPTSTIKTLMSTIKSSDPATITVPTTRFDDFSNILSRRFTETISISDFLATLDSLNAVNPTTLANLIDGITKVPMASTLRTEIDDVTQNLTTTEMNQAGEVSSLLEDESGRVQNLTRQNLDSDSQTTVTTEPNSQTTESNSVTTESNPANSLALDSEVKTTEIPQLVELINRFDSSSQMTESTVGNTDSQTEISTKITEASQNSNLNSQIQTAESNTQTTESGSQASDSVTQNSESTTSTNDSIENFQTTELNSPNSDLRQSMDSDSQTTEPSMPTTHSMSGITQNSLQTDDLMQTTESSTETPTTESNNVESTTMSSSTLLELISRLLEATGTTPNTISSTLSVGVERTSTVRPSTDSGFSTLANFEVSPGSVTVFSANDVTSMFNQPDDGTTVTIFGRAFTTKKPNQIMNSSSNDMNVTVSNDANSVLEANSAMSLSMSSELSNNSTNASMDSFDSSSMSVENGTNTNNTERSGRLLAVDPVPVQNDIETTTTPAKDYFIFAILPNNTILRKRPSMYPNKNTPFIIVGVYPNNTVVQKFPNGTLIPEEPVVKTSAKEIATMQPIVEVTTNQVPIPTLTDLVGGKTAKEFTNILNQTDGEKNSTLEIVEPVQNNGNDTEEVNIEENTISNNGNNKPEKIIQSTTIRGTAPTTQTVKSPTTESILTTMGKNLTDATTIGTNNENTEDKRNQRLEESLPEVPTVVPDFNLVESDLSQLTTPTIMTRYTNTPTTVSSELQDIQLTIRPTTPYFIQRMLGNFTTIGSRLGAENNNIMETTTKTPETTTQTMVTTPQFVPSIRIRTSTTQATTTTESTTIPTTTTTTPIITTTPITTTTPAPTTARITIAQTTTTPEVITTQPTTTRSPTTTMRRRGGRFRTTTQYDSLIRTVTVTPSTFPTDPSLTDSPSSISTTMYPSRRFTVTPTTVTQPSKVATFAPATITTAPLFQPTTTFETPTVFPVYTSNPILSETTFDDTIIRAITKTPTTLPPAVLPSIEELQRLAELRVLENFGELSTTNDFVRTTTPIPTTLQTTLKSVNAKVKLLSEQQKKDLEELAKLEKEQAQILQQLAFLTRLNLGGATPKPTRSPSNLANRVLEYAAERDQKTTTENPLDILSTLTNTRQPKKVAPGTKDISLDELLKQLNVNPETVTSSSLGATYGQSTDAILAALLKEQGIGPSTPKSLGDQLKTTTPVSSSTSQRITTRRRITTTTTPRPGPLMQGLNWLLNMWAPPPAAPTRKPAPKRKVTTTPKLTTVAEEIEMFSSQPTEMSPVVVTAPQRKPPSRGARKHKRPLHALSEQELSSLISQLEEAQKDPTKAKNIDLSAFEDNESTQKSTTLVANNAVQITNSGKVGTSSKLQVASSSDSEVIYSRKSTTPIPAGVSNSIFDEVETVTKPPRRTKAPTRTTLPPVRLDPVPGIDIEGEPQVRGQLISAAVNVTRAISQFLGSAIQDAAYQLTHIFSNTTNLRQYLSASDILPSLLLNTTQPIV